MTTSGIRFAFAPLQYAIATPRSINLVVSGYAVRLPEPFDRLRVCVRPHLSRWMADHYDSGYAIGFRTPLSPLLPLDQCQRIWREEPELDGTTRSRLVESLYKGLLWAHENGRLRRMFAAAGYGWCLDEAGL